MSKRHIVAVIGGATAGAEVAARLAERGAEVVVFEQNPRPFGKIEDGLPRWHGALRRKEYGIIGGKLARTGVHFVPCTKIGRDLDFAELARDWGFSAVVLACGAWWDRRLAVDGVEDFVGKGLVYQNPFIVWFNHFEEAGYDGPQFETPDGAMVIGGGLASIDVAKVMMLETVRAALAARGIEVAMLDLELKGIPKFLAKHALQFEELGLEGCTIFYRRRVEDMPLVEIPEGATPEREEKVRNSRKRLLEKAMEKYCFRLEPLSLPDAPIAENGRLVGLRFRRTRIEAGRVVSTDETFERRGSVVLSSIGSVPAPIAGIPMKGELFDFKDWQHGRLEGYPGVFSVGNVVTGKGNIVASRKHAAKVSEEAIETFLGLGDGDREAEAELAGAEGAALAEQVEAVANAVKQQPAASPETLARIRERVAARQAQVGYDAGFHAWIEKVSPR